jgi:class 3 adenylate cyclase/tetratricopeptide (TPR) repeat protein
MTTIENSRIDELRQAITSLEAQRELLGDAVVDTSVEALNKQLAELAPADVEAVQQRKLATILFTDIVGHTKLVQDLDPEVNMAIIDEALVRLATVVEAHGGHITRYQGDGFKAVFGLPTAHETDPENAVRAGLGIIASAEVYARKLEEEHGLTGFNVRVGIDTGLVVAGGVTEADDTIKGLVVNLAARLESAAPAGGLLISQHTFQHVREFFEVQKLEPIIAKGFPDSVPVYLVKRTKAHVFHRGMRGVEGIETKMVGRDEELGRLQEVFQMVVHQQQIALVTIMGEAGVGKSRLSFEFEKWLEQQPKAVQQFTERAAPETKSIAQYLWRELLAAEFQILDSDRLETLHQKFVAGVSAHLPKDGEMKAHILGGWLGYNFVGSPHLTTIANDTQQLKRRATLYLAEYIAAKAAKTPVVILLEDVHWADRGSLDTVADLVKRGQRLPVLVVCMARPSLLERSPEWGEGIANHKRINLKPLSAANTDALVIEILRLAESLPPELLVLVRERAEGNPFYAEELIKMMIDQGSIVTGTNSWQVKPRALEAFDIPPTLTGVLQARLDRLKPEEKETLQQASVIGRIFWDKALQTLSEEGPLALPVLQAKEFIYDRANSAFARTVEYIFKHALLRDVTYETVLLRLRQGYHLRIAHWIETRAADRLDEFAGLIAEHYTKAAANDMASAYWEKAGDAAAMSSDFFGARDAFERALELEPTKDRHRLAELECKLADMMGFVGQKEASVDLYRHALSRFDGAPAAQKKEEWQRARLRILLGLTSALYWSMQREALEDSMAETKSLLEEVGTRVQQGSFHFRQSQVIFVQNNYRANEECLKFARKALAYAEGTGNARSIAFFQFHLGFNLLWAGKLEESILQFNEALESSQQINNTFGELQCLLYRSISFRMQEEVDRVARFQSELIDLAQEIGYPEYIAVARANGAWLHYQRGRWQQALEESMLVEEIWKRSRYPFTWLGHWVLLASALKGQQLGDAVTGARKLLDCMDVPPGEISSRLESAVSAWEVNDKDRTNSALEEAVELAVQNNYL